MEKHMTIAVDLSKTVFEIAVSDEPGRVRERKRLSRRQMIPFFSQRPPAVVLLEACGSSHYWARQIQALGHHVRLLPPHHTRRYVLRNKTDSADATALLEANRNEQIAPVPIKSLTQQTIASLHRLRSCFLATRTARINTIRGILRELGVLIPVGPCHVLPKLTTALSDPSQPIPEALHSPLLSLATEIRDLESKIRDTQRQLQTLSKNLPTVQRHLSIPGVGLLTASALTAFVGDFSRFHSGRRFASFLGIVPKEHSSGQRRRLGAIAKSGDPYLRTLLIHGARSVLLAAKRSQHPDRLRCWALDLQRRRGHNKAAVALANKLARIAWATAVRDSDYVSHPTS